MTDNSTVDNFLVLLKLHFMFGLVMKEHLVQTEKHPGSTSYLSSSVQNKFIRLMASRVWQRLLKIKYKAKYYSAMSDQAC